MTQTIYKYSLPITDNFRLFLPLDPKILSAQVQNGLPCMWVQLDLSKAKAFRSFHLMGTGHPMPPPEALGPFDGSFQLPEQGLVFHLFEAA